MSSSKCGNDIAGLEYRCHGGYLWELTYSEMGPPGQRQNTGQPCPLCNGKATRRVRLTPPVVPPIVPDTTKKARNRVKGRKQ